MTIDVFSLMSLTFIRSHSQIMIRKVYRYMKGLLLHSSSFQMANLESPNSLKIHFRLRGSER